jgi:hypothetical protein
MLSRDDAWWACIAERLEHATDPLRAAVAQEIRKAWTSPSREQKLGNLSAGKPGWRRFIESAEHECRRQPAWRCR